MIQAVYNKLWITLLFDFESHYSLLIKKLRHLSLFSICLHFLRRRRSREIKPNYYKFCSRVTDNHFYEYNAFLSYKMDCNGYLNTKSSELIDFDGIFFTKRAYFQYDSIRVLLFRSRSCKF